MRTRNAIAAGLMLVCCARPPATRGGSPTELSPVKLFPIGAPLQDWADGLDDSENRFGLNLIGIAAADPQHVVLFGNLRAGGKSFRSVLLASEDEGLTWRETLPPYATSEITHAAFVGCTGWALIGWRDETPGDLTLAGTGDCGQSWFTLSELPKTEASGWPLAMEFDDTFNGVVTVAYAERDLGRGFLRTHDGGRNWNEVFGQPRRDEVGRLQRVFQSRDAGGWKVDAEGPRYVVRHRANAEQLWEPVAVLPQWLRVDGGDFRPITGR